MQPSRPAPNGRLLSPSASQLLLPCPITLRYRAFLLAQALTNDDTISCRRPGGTERQHPAPSVVVVLNAEQGRQALGAVPHPHRVVK